MAKLWQSSNKKGQVLIELMVGMALAALMMPAMITAFFAARGGSSSQDERTRAVAYVRQAREIVEQLKVQDWQNVATNGNYRIALANGLWSLTSGDETLGIFNRRITLADSYRDGSGNLATSGTVDPSTKKVTVTVSWSNGGITRSERAEYYIMRLENLGLTETTVADFSDGIKTGTVVSPKDGGEVTLGAGGGGDWCNPSLTMSAFDLPKSGAANAVSAIEGRIFAGTGENASGVSFANLSMAVGNPPTVNLLGTYDGYKTNDIFGESNYAYLATDSNSKEILIVNLTTNPYSEAGYYNAPGNGSGEAIYVDGSVGYVVSGSKLYSFDLSAKTGSRTTIGSVNLAGTGTSIYVKNGYAYVAIDSTSTELQIVSVSNPTAMSVVGSLNVTGERGVDAYVNQTSTRAFLATQNSASQPEFFVINIENKSSPSVIGSFDTGAMSPTGLRVVTFNRVVVVGYGGTEYQIVDISSEGAPTTCGSGLNIDSGIRDLDSVITGSSAYSYIVTGDASAELKIIEGGPGGQYAAEGVYESGIFDATSSAVFNRVETISGVPAQTDLRLQVAVAAPVSGSCNGASYYYTGPDGTSSSFYTTSGGAIPLGIVGSYTNPGRCMRYKAYLSTAESTVAPSLLSITFNYSP